MNEASQRQIEAAEPTASTWLSANAGSGKTRVLTDRVARLLLQGVEPQRILCLTYTKAAASEMQNRLFARLGEWAMLEPTALTRQLTALGEHLPEDPAVLARARRLFARAIETPGGLKIQTIHSFCSALLRRFPLEAGVAPDFKEIEERSLHQLRLELLDTMASGPQAGLLRDLAGAVSESALMRVLDDLGRYRDVFGPDAPEIDLHALFDLPQGFDEAALLAQVFDGHEAGLAERLVPAFLASGSNDQKLGEKLKVLFTPGMKAIEVLEAALLYSEAATKAEPFTAKTGALGTKGLRKSLPSEALEALEALASRVEVARPLRLGLAALLRAQALHRFARHWLPALEVSKAARGWLDFDDLILRAHRLLSDPAVAQWVLFKLDGGIDHILIDEAQDTSPAQWRVIELLAQEFTAGQSARDTLRTIFVVGDKKQSIYSFQGADLRGFDRMRAQFHTALESVGQKLNHMELLHSFRSSDAVLRLVDACFAPREAPTGLGGTVEHLAFHETMPGRVDLWPPIPPAQKMQPGEWDEPLDRPGETNQEVVLAGQIAAEISAMIARGERIETASGLRPVHEGDFLILVRRRRLLFHALIRACKAQGLQIAGADRLTLSDELAVQDILALLRFLALPEDDLSLAEALRSALFGWSEDRLFRLAQGRGGQYLWERLRTDPDHADTRAILDDLRSQADFMRPYELIERILTRHDGRRRLLARLGVEAEEAIEAFVGLALTYERENVPTLDGFLGWIAASDAEIKRQSEGAGRRIRVMTVHGAKGLEAPIVILPDTAARREDNRAALAQAGGVPILRAAKASAPEVQRRADAAQAEERQEEGDRLLYVALTRAERWLIVAAAGETENSWYARVEQGLKALGATEKPLPTGTGLRFEHHNWPTAVPAPRGPAAEAPSGDHGLDGPVPAALSAPLLTPSRLGGAKALPGEAGLPEAQALIYGHMLHLLLEHLPALPVQERAVRAQDLLAGTESALAAACLADVDRLLATPSLAPVLVPEAGAGSVFSEVALSGRWQGRALWGVIDRLILTPDRILAVDFKSNRTIPENPEDVPEGLLRQMGAYAHMLASLYPGKRVETALLWTGNASLMTLPSTLTDAALARAALDPGLGAS